jgi:DNA-binding NarL/FixJ family response regulator
VDVIRDALFTKLDVRSRVGMAMVALRNGVVTH